MLRARAIAWVYLLAVFAGCGDGGPSATDPATGSSTSGSSDVDTSGTSVATAADETTMGAVACPAGAWGCACRDGDAPCDGTLVCIDGACDECPIGLLGCACTALGACADPLLCAD